MKKNVAYRFPGDHVGEMAAIEPTQPRAASVIPVETSVLLKVSEVEFSAAAEQFPDVRKRIAAMLARRLAERNHLVTAQRERVRVFIMSSVEVLPFLRPFLADGRHPTRSGRNLEALLLQVITVILPTCRSLTSRVARVLRSPFKALSQGLIAARSSTSPSMLIAGVSKKP